MNNAILVRSESDLGNDVLYLTRLEFNTEDGYNYRILCTFSEHTMSTVLANLSRDNQHKDCYTFTPIHIQEPCEMD